MLEVWDPEIETTPEQWISFNRFLSTDNGCTSGGTEPRAVGGVATHEEQFTCMYWSLIIANVVHNGRVYQINLGYLPANAVEGRSLFERMIASFAFTA